MPLTKPPPATSQGKEVPLPPKVLTSPGDRARARRIRDAQWYFMQRVADLGTLWWCRWNEDTLPEGPDECRMRMISGLELHNWMHTHPAWWDIGDWEDTRLRPAGAPDGGGP